MGRIYTEEEITVNMKDAGFSDKEIRDFLELMKQGSEKQAFRILGKHRDELLEILHKTRDSISCIDYLTYRISEGKEAEYGRRKEREETEEKIPFGA